MAEIGPRFSVSNLLDSCPPPAHTSPVPVTAQEMRDFAADCLRWADDAKNASQRELMIRMAQSWLATAAALERREDVLPDLRGKLD
jgi:hypothetical protein